MHIEHAALWTRDLKRIRSFYETYFDATSSEEYANEATAFRSYFLTFASGARLEVMTRPDLTEEQGGTQVGYAHIAVSLGSTEAVDRLTERLTEDGYPCVDGPRWTGDGYYESKVRDPDGNLLELTR